MSTERPTLETTLRALAEAATPGPWAVDGPANPGPGDALAVYPEEDGGAIAYVQPLWPDAAHIAAFHPGTALALLDRLAEAEAERDQAIEWVEEHTYPLVMRQGETLTSIAASVNGPPPARTSWSHHDLAEKVAALVAERDALRAQVERVREMHEPIPVSEYTIACSCGWWSHDDCPTVRALDGDA